jgi:predicted amidohydrolase YtcJ
MLAAGFLVGFAIGAAAVVAAQPDAATGAADWLFSGGLVYTVDPTRPHAEAVAVRGDTIVYVGDRAGAAAWKGKDTREVDLSGRMLLPGFVDAHDHLSCLGATKLGVNVRGLKGNEAILERVRSWVEQQPEDAVLRGHGWSMESFGGASPRREWLDAVTGDRPMYVLSFDMHDLWFNTAAMRLAGVTATTPDLSKTQYYERDPDGTPTGHCHEDASMQILLAMGFSSPETIREAQKLTIDRAPGYGITTFMEAGVLIGPTNHESEWVYRQLIERDRRGDLPLRVVGTVWTRSMRDDPREIAALLRAWNQRLRSDHVQISICKLWSDGVLLSGGALTLEAYSDDPLSHGRMTFDGDHIQRQIEATQEAGFDMHIHVDADGSTRTVLDALERARDRIGNRGTRHTICHNTMVHPDDIPRYKQLGVIANATPLWGTDYDGVLRASYEKRIGTKRIEERLLPYGDLERAGAIVTYGADIPGVDLPEIAPLIQIEAAVTRKRPGFPDDLPLVPRQRVTVAEAIKNATWNGAYQLRLEDRIGSIEVGKQADLVVLGADLFQVPPERIHAVPVVLTLMDGRPTHDATRDGNR